MMPRLMVRKPAAQGAMASIAWPVWFSVVFAIDTSYLIADRDCQREFFVRFRYWLVHRRKRNDDAKRRG